MLIEDHKHSNRFFRRTLLRHQTFQPLKTEKPGEPGSLKPSATYRAAFSLITSPDTVVV
jgi:hypothetical protein